MNRISKAAMVSVLATLIFYNAHKPQDHEEVAESPTGTETIPSAVPPQNREAQPTGGDTAKVEIAEPTPKTQIYEATFYTAGCGGCTGITASGVNVRNTTHVDGYRVLAADKSVPFGTIMRITLEDGTVFDGIVADRGGAIKGRRLDILVETRARAYELGRQQVKVEIIE